MAVNGVDNAAAARAEEMRRADRQQNEQKAADKARAQEPKEPPPRAPREDGGVDISA